MLKKRILASSMASVMALGSVSVVAFADEAADKKYGEAVTAKELQAYIDSFDKFITDELPDYGSTQGEKFQAAIDHAKAVLGDEEKTEVAINAAYQMIKAVEGELTKYTESQLKTLLAENKSKYDKNNLLNEEIQDLIYTEDSYAKFTAAYDDAENFVDSGDSRLITDAYVALSDAVDGLSDLKKVSKAAFRTALKDYEQLELEMKKYESWRRGKLNVVPETGTAKDKSKLKNANLSMAQLIALVYGADNEGNVNILQSIDYWDKTEWKNVDATKVSSDDEADHKGEGRFIGGYEIGKDEALKNFINDKYDQFDNVKGATVTTDKAIYAAYNAAIDAVAVFKSWEPDGYKSGSKSSCANLEKKYHSQLVMTFNMDDVELLIDTLESWDKETYSDDDSDKKSDSAGLKVTLDTGKKTLKSNKSFAIVKNKKTGLIRNIADLYPNRTKAKEQIDEDAAEEYVEQTISAGTNILTYLGYDVDVLSTLVTDFNDAVDDNTTHVKELADANWSVNKKADAKFATDTKYFNKTGEVYTFYEIKAASGYERDAGTAAVVSAHNAWVSEVSSLYDTVKSKREKVYKVDASTSAVTGAAKDYADAFAAIATEAGNLNNSGSAPTAGGDTAYTVVADIIAIKQDDGTTAVSGLGTAGAVKYFQANEFDTDGSGKVATADELKKVNDKVDAAKKKYEALEKAMKEYIVNTPATGSAAAVDSAVTKFTKALKDTRIIDDDANTASPDKNYGEDGTGNTSAFVVIDDADYLVAKKDYTGNDDETFFTLKVKSSATGDDKKAAQVIVDAHNKEVKRLKNRYDLLVSMSDNEDSVGALTSLVAADACYTAYKNFDFKKDEDCEAALAIMEAIADGKTVPKAQGSATEWTLIWRQLAYALEDAFPEATVTKYTLKDLEDMIERAYVATEGTGDSSLFATIHQPVVDQRQIALDWLKEAKSVTGYKTDDIVDGSTLEDQISDLKSPVETLEKWLKDFLYSYEEIRNKIGEVSKAIENGDVKSSAELKKALNDCSYDLSVLEATDVFDEGDGVNPAFSDERVFQYANRLKTGDSKTKFEPNEFEKNLKKSYEALDKAYKAAQTPAATVVPGDVNGDGKFALSDVSAMIAAYNNDQSVDASKDKAWDFNGDGKWSLADVSAAITKYMNG